MFVSSRTLPLIGVDAFTAVVYGLLGSGSFQTACLDVEVVADQKQVQANQVHLFGLGERKGFPDKAGQALADGVSNLWC